ncbi:hypothetical protein PCASD_08518 [Puccinia coronata f. sp. avenae]|uniref:Uncharacterized protein n=1 Tax=Puccinia coronata f. sp. avenae TaxID=200324 RepID=A0A2N5UY85_9BASI|nr:hypothetical protein PCASD_08518 [Puccinia coronata f. sp. avenae]
MQPHFNHPRIPNNSVFEKPHSHTHQSVYQSLPNSPRQTTGPPQHQLLSKQSE